MSRHADTLADLRKPGRTDEQIRECIEALAVPLHATDPVCVILDTAIRDLVGYEDDQREVAELSKSDLDHFRRIGEYDAATIRSTFNTFTREAV